MDNKAFTRYFIVLNNCGDFKVTKGLNNEFDYPPMVAFYKPKASEIVKFVPNTFTIGMGHYYLAEYDMTKKAFPFTDTALRKQTVVFNNVTPGESGPGLYTCPGATRPSDFPAYMVTFKEVKFTELALDEAAARNFAAQTALVSGFRPVSIELDIEVLPTLRK